MLCLLKEPLLHFAALALLLFAVPHLSGERSLDHRPDSIVVSEARILNLAELWRRTWQRPPSEFELKGLIEDHVQEEILYREALAQGLDHDDTVIRRRLRQKLEFIAEDMGDLVEPSTAQLQQYLEKHAADFRLEDRASFSQVYLDRRRPADELDKKVKQLLRELRSEGAPAAAQLGDPIMLLHRYDNLPESEIAGLFGRPFCRRLMSQEQNEQWFGPVESGYGVHLVALHQRTRGVIPKLATVREAVRRDWFAARRTATKERFYRQLRQRYDVLIHMPEAAFTDAQSSQRP